MINVFIGYDSREPIAYEVLKFSILKHASGAVNIHPLKLDKLTDQQLLTRDFHLTDKGNFYDVISEAPASTEFAISRFLAPLLLQAGMGVFMDCDMVLTDDIYELVEEYEPRYAVQCVKHNHKPTEVTKMDGQVQTTYPRKNWSSFYIFNSEHEANRRLSLWTVNNLAGRDLHAFCWLNDEEIGELSGGWNWLVNEQEKPERLYNAHFTNGGPWFPNWKPTRNDDLWLLYKDDYMGSL